jgi:hypothetical protein
MSYTATPYLKKLQEDPDGFQLAIEDLLAKYCAQPVGNGYIDLILDVNAALKLMDALTRLPVAVRMVSWWCLCTEESKLNLGCPHGGGGPLNQFGEGWFSECYQYPDFDLEEGRINFDDPSTEPHALAHNAKETVSKYLLTTLPTEKFFSPCLYPGLWLEVPRNWSRKHYLVED